VERFFHNCKGMHLSKGDTMAPLNELQDDFNLKSFLFDEYPNNYRDSPEWGKPLCQSLEYGRANYDILFPTEEAAVN